MTETTIKDTICRYAWDYPILGISRNELRFCCRARPHTIFDDDMKRGTDLFTGFIPVIELRKNLLRGVKADDCRTCWQIEDSGGKPPRTDFEEFVPWVHKHQVWPGLSREEVRNRLLNLNDELIEDLIKIDVTRMIEINLGNTCDLKCMYCNHHYSSQWATEKLKYNEIKIEEIETELPKVDTAYEDIFWKWFEEKTGATTNAINFIGGEPLIMNKFYSYFDRIVKFYQTNQTKNDKKYVDISIVTNFNTPPKLFQKFLSNVVDIISSSQILLDLNVSCESIEKRAEFIRTGTDWELMDGNIKKMLEYKSMVDIRDNLSVIPERVNFNFQIALNNLCISDLPNFFKYVIDLEETYGVKINLRPNQITDPSWLSPSILSPHYAVYIDESISLLNERYSKRDNNIDYSVFGDWKKYIKFLETVKNTILNTNKNIQAQKDFATNINKLCERRNLNFNETFPEMISFYEECKNVKEV
jgi:hypothetical protein